MFNCQKEITKREEKREYKGGRKYYMQICRLKQDFGIF